MEGAQWTPSDQGLKEICELLAEYQKPSANHAQIYQRIEEYSTQPEFSNYLAFLLAEGSNFPSEVRQCAGLLLKNKLRSHFVSLPEENLKYIHGLILRALELHSPSLRQTAGTVISSIVCSVGLHKEPGLITHLAMLIGSTDTTQKNGGLDTMLKICEDCPQAFEGLLADAQPTAIQLLDLIVHQFFNECSELRRLAIAIMNIVIGQISTSQEQIIQRYREGLFRLHADPEPLIRKEVCYGMTQLVVFHQEFMVPYLKDVIHFMLECTKQDEVAIVMESCEFWTAFVDASLEPTELQPVLGELLPILLNNMVYEDDDEAVLLSRSSEIDGLENDSELPPFIPGQNGAAGTADEESGNDDEEVCGAWTLRKCSAAGLDKLSTMFGNELLQHVLPLIQQRIQSPDWKQRECAVLVLGAISDGCRSGLDPHLDSVLQELLAKISDPEALVRVISCWALGRYSERIIHRAVASPDFIADVDRIFSAVVKSIHDKNKQVQLAACSALATIEEFSGAVLVPRLKFILENLADVCQWYGRRSLRMVYDAIAILAERVGTPLAETENRALIMCPLLTLYDRICDDDKELQPLLACLSSLASALGNSFEEYTIPIYNRCLRIVNAQLEASKISINGTSAPSTDTSFTVSALDLISGLIEGMGTSMECLVGQSNLIESLIWCCQSKDADIRQSAFALLGELAKICPSHLRSRLHHLSMLCVDNFAHQALTEDALSACNNACWALGEVALHCTHEQMQPVAIKVLENCVNIIMHSRCLPRSLVENATVTLGRVAILCAPDFAPHLHVYVGDWCQMMRNIRDDIEKEQAFTGLFTTVALNLNGAVKAFPSICMAVASWTHGISDALKAQMRDVMQRLKQVLQSAGEWDAVWMQLPDAVKVKLENPGSW